MSAKAAIQYFKDAQLVRIFIDFIQAYSLKYEKSHKEISYKCFEAMWSLEGARAIGYGRTDKEAYKNALKNLLQLLIEQPLYIEYFSAVLSKIKVDKDYSRNPSPTKIQLKTEGYEAEAKSKVRCDSFSKILYAGRPKQDITMSKINLNRSMHNKNQSEIESAKNKLKALQERLAAVLQQNKILKEKIVNVDTKGQRQAKNQRAGENKNGSLEKRAKNMVCLKQEKFRQKSQKNLQSVEKLNISKIAVPKLNLQVLPNYSKKSQKCLNQMLLAAYNQNHCAQKKNA